MTDMPAVKRKGSLRLFLRLIWDIFADEGLGSRVHFILAMNQPHYARAYNISEIMGKFRVIRFKPLTREELVGIHSARLKLVKLEIIQVFDDETIDLILKYTCGITRNALTICDTLYNTTPEGEKITIGFALPIIKSQYPNAVIEDRATDATLVPIYKGIIEAMQNAPDNMFDSKELLIRQICRVSGRGRCLILEYINDLIKWGLIEEKRGGMKRTNRILTLTFKSEGSI